VEQSILKSTKKMLGLDASYTAFDLDVLTNINITFSNLTQIGILPDNGFAISDNTTNWAALGLSVPLLSMVKSYVYLKVRMLFDPPTTSFLLKAYEDQIKEYEWRLTALKEYES
jgi:hypothetical protein